jgi:hypothetical protein
MLAIRGTFENGKIILKEKPKTLNKTDVIVTFLEEETEQPKRRKAGGIGKVWMSDDFNDPLEDFKDYM